jgi:hypothetical protein
VVKRRLAAVGVAFAVAAVLAPAPASAGARCGDAIVKVIREAGWESKRDRRTAYAIAWRESNHRPGVIGSGSYGLFQFQASVWQGTRFWPSSPLNALSNAKAAHRLWRAASWRPWGISRDGTGVDARDYAWSADRVQAWIWNPYMQGVARWKALPRGCRT